MFLHEIEILSRWYCTLFALAMGMFVFWGIGRLTEDWELLDRDFPGRSFYPLKIDYSRLIGITAAYWLIGFVLMTIAHWIVGEFPPIVNLALFYLFYFCVCVGPFTFLIVGIYLFCADMIKRATISFRERGSLRWRLASENNAVRKNGLEQLRLRRTISPRYLPILENITRHDDDPTLCPLAAEIILRSGNREAIKELVIFWDHGRGHEGRLRSPEVSIEMLRLFLDATDINLRFTMRWCLERWQGFGNLSPEALRLAFEYDLFDRLVGLVFSDPGERLASLALWVLAEIGPFNKTGGEELYSAKFANVAMELLKPELKSPTGFSPNRPPAYEASRFEKIYDRRELIAKLGLILRCLQPSEHTQLLVNVIEGILTKRGLSHVADESTQELAAALNRLRTDNTNPHPVEVAAMQEAEERRQREWRSRLDAMCNDRQEGWNN